jgi:hypothetical protein
MGTNIVGPTQLRRIAARMGIDTNQQSLVEPPPVPLTELQLQLAAKDYVLVLAPEQALDGGPASILRMKSFFGWDPGIREPCFYNQDWYLKEDFARINVPVGWHLLRRSVRDDSRGQQVDAYLERLHEGVILPSAALCAYAFFVFYFVSMGEMLWEHDYIWCSDHDANGDRIYVGRYHDPSGKSKSGFSIHRHLRIRECYGVSDQIPS